MRIWHKDLIDILPDRLLMDLWDTCCIIARRIMHNGFTGDWCSSRVTQYPVEEFWAYARLVHQEITAREIQCNFGEFAKWFPNLYGQFEEITDRDDIFKDWHTKRYLWQCYSELEERMDCGQIKFEDWIEIAERMSEVTCIA